MKAMILAAGKGTRVAPFTLTTPKPLLKVFGQPVIENIIGFLRRNQVEEVAINTSYLGDKIQHLLGDGSRYGMEFTYSFEGTLNNGEIISTPLGSAGGLREVQRKYNMFDGTFLVICGDAIIDFDLDYALSFHRSRESLATVITKRVPDEKVCSYGVVDLSEGKRIRGFQEKPSAREAMSNLVSTGIYLFEPEIFDHIPDYGEFDIGGELLPMLAERGDAIYACETPIKWVDIGTVNDLWNANMNAMEGRVPHVPMKGRTITPNVTAAHSAIVDWDTCQLSGSVHIGSGSVIESGVTLIGPVIIGDNCHIGRNSTLTNIITDNYTRVHTGTTLSNRWITPDFAIDLSSSETTVQCTNKPTEVSDLRNVTPETRNVRVIRRSRSQ